MKAEDVLSVYDAFTSIVDFLGADNIFKLEETCRVAALQCRKLRSARYLTRRVEAMVRTWGMEANDFCGMLDVAVLSGSSLLHSLLGDALWFYKDVDIFVEHDAEKTRPMKDRLYAMAVEQCEDVENIGEIFVNSIDDVVNINPALRSVTSYRAAFDGQVDVQIISVHGSLERYVENEFDQQYLSNTYGRTGLMIYGNATGDASSGSCQKSSSTWQPG